MKNKTPSFPIASKHHVKLVAPGVLRMALIGDISSEDMRYIYDYIEDVSQGRSILLLVDLTKAGALGADARRVAVDDPRSRFIAARALVGASFHMRVVVELMYKAACFFHGRARLLAFFDDETSALEWLKSRRPQLGRAMEARL